MLSVFETLNRTRARHASRLGTLTLFSDDLQRAYGEDFKIMLTDVEFDEHKHICPAEVTNSYTAVHNLVKQFPLFVVNHSNALEAAERMRAQLLSLGIEAIIAADINPEGLNIHPRGTDFLLLYIVSG